MVTRCPPSGTPTPTIPTALTSTGAPANNRPGSRRAGGGRRSRNQLGLGPIDQPRRAHHVHLPQLYRTRSLPPHEVLPAPLARQRLHPAVAHQHPVHRRPRRHRIHPGPAQLVHQQPRTPPRMIRAQLHQQRLDLRTQLPRMPMRAVRAVRQPGQPTLAIPGQPRVHSLAGHPLPAGDPGHLCPAEHLHHRVIPLLHNTQLHEHQPGPFPLRDIARKDAPGRQRHHQVEPACNPSNGVGQRPCACPVRTFFTGLNAASPRVGASGPGRAGHAAWRPFRARPVPSAAGTTKQHPVQYQGAALSSLVITFYCSVDGRGRRVPGCRKPQQ